MQTLSGSEKQISWAGDLRTAEISILNSEIRRDQDTLRRQLASVGTPDAPIQLEQGIMNSYQKIAQAQAAIMVLKDATSAKDIIENRGNLKNWALRRGAAQAR